MSNHAMLSIYLIFFLYGFIVTNPPSLNVVSNTNTGLVIEVTHPEGATSSKLQGSGGDVIDITLTESQQVTFNNSRLGSTYVFTATAANPDNDVSAAETLTVTTGKLSFVA